MSRVIIVHPEWGVFLGCTLRAMLWSKVNPEGVHCALTFDDERHARELIDIAMRSFGPLQLLAVNADIYGEPFCYASVAACVTAGAPAWITEDMPTVGGVQ